MEENTVEAEEPQPAPEPVEEEMPEPEPAETEPPAEAAAGEATPEPEPAETEPPAEIAPPGPTFRERWAATITPVMERLGERFAWLGGGRWIYGAIAILVIVALLLPPISLPQRLGLVGYTRLDADTPSTSHPDGLTVGIDPEDGADTSLRVRLESVPMADFLAGAAGSDLRHAVESLPQVLQIKSPYYQIDTTSREAGPARLEVVIPNDAEPWETLDLYTWTGETWEWVGGTLDEEQEVLVAEVDHLPSSLVVMQTSPVVPSIGTVTEQEVEGHMADALTELLLPGFYLGTDGTLLGHPTPLPGDQEQVLFIRNYQEEGPNPALLSDVLTDPDIQQTHIDAIVAAATGYAGVALDYQGVAAEERDAFASFVTGLAEALHNQDIRLNVAVPAPTRSGEGWESGGYDWKTLGQAADALLVPFPMDPAAYTESGELQSLLRWAVGQVNRYKLHALISALSVDTSAAGVQTVGLEEALAPFGQVTPPSTTSLNPGQETTFTLAGQVSSIMRDEVVGTYSIAYQDEGGTDHTIWLGTPSFLAHKLDWALRYHLGGVVIADMTDEGNLPDILAAVDGYRTAANLTQPAELQVTWTVEGPEASLDQEVVSLSQPDFRWVAPETPGTYAVSAAIAGMDRGTVEMTVATPTPEPTLTPEPVADASCLRATFEADVTVPDGTHFDKGEPFTKTWRLRNSGTCDWPADTVLVVSSSQLGGPESVEIGAVPAGESVEISIGLAAPDSDGSFNGLWLLKAGGVEIPGSELTAVIVSGSGATSASNPAPIAAIPPGTFELGGHVRDMALPYADLMHYAGMTWAKVQVHYNEDASWMVQAAHSRGFKIQLSALGSPDMVTQPGFEQNFANWVAGLAASGADAIEVWNEPNLMREWDPSNMGPQAYTNLLCASYNAIKGANPNVLVISAAPAPTGAFGGTCDLTTCSDWNGCGCDDQPWLEGLYNAGAAQCMDYIGAHHNAGATSPSASTGHPADDGNHHHSWYFLPQTQLYYNIFHGTRQVFYTEMGYASQEGVPTFTDCTDWVGPCSSFAWARGIDNSEQAAWLSEAVQLGINTGMVRCIIVWNIDFQRYGYDPQDGFAIIRPGGICPACDSLHAVLGTR